mmetsp:Transcript_30897/g.95031  ORF Transcript_30897/g.95031 Transcript_30897/m.95031 type:complete len:295 (-) Transcript_30897:318-1202(-)
MVAESGPQAMAEVAELLDQCSPHELTDILRALEGSGLAASVEKSPEALAAPLPAAPPQPQAPRRDIVPPSRPPPQGAGRRPCPTTKKRSEGECREAGAGTSSTAVTTAGEHSDDRQLTMNEIKRLLDEHSASVVSEVRKMLPAAPVAVPQAVQNFSGEMIDLSTLTQTLSERDREVRALESQLADLQAELATKDKRVAELGGELDRTVREVRHKQLDLEFQQLKLEERVRSNAELEQAQRKLTARVEEASLNARHAALDVDMCLTTPRTLRAQGTLPWTVRKNRLPAVGPATAR